MAIKLGFNKKKDDDYYYGEDSYYTKGDDAIEEETGNVAFDDSDVKELPREESTGAFGGINEEAVALKVMAPKSYGEATKVADSLIAGSTVVLNVEALETDEMLRFMDFLMGVLYVIRGNMKKVSQTTVVVSPSSIADESDMQGE